MIALNVSSHPSAIHKPLVEFADIVEDAPLAYVVAWQARGEPLELFLCAFEMKPRSFGIEPLLPPYGGKLLSCTS